MSYYCPSCNTVYTCHENNMNLCLHANLICFDCLIKYDIYNKTCDKITFTIRDNSIVYNIHTREYSYKYTSFDNECIINGIHCYVFLRDDTHYILLLPTYKIPKRKKKII